MRPVAQHPKRTVHAPTPSENYQEESIGERCRACTTISRTTKKTKKNKSGHYLSVVVRVHHIGSIPQAGESCMPKPTPSAKMSKQKNRQTTQSVFLCFRFFFQREKNNNVTNTWNEWSGRWVRRPTATARSESVKQKSVRERFSDNRLGASHNTVKTNFSAKAWLVLRVSLTLRRHTPPKDSRISYFLSYTVADLRGANRARAQGGKFTKLQGKKNERSNGKN